MNSLYELSSQYQQLLNVVMESDDLSSEIMELLESINDSLENKILNYASIIKNIEANATSIKQAANEMLKRADKLEKNADRLRLLVKEQMESCHKDKIENNYHEIKLKLNNPRVDYIDSNLIPAEFIRKKIKEIEEPNGTLILKALKDNISIPGVRMVRDSRLEIK